LRKIDLDPPATRTWQRWLADCDKATAKVCALVAEGKKAVFTKLYRRKSIRRAFFFSSGPPFYGKCAYCETDIVGYQHGDVEHFRPKAGVTDEGDLPIDEHPGYYWLAYDWRNLLPSCEKCNQPSEISGRKVGKHNRFPVEGRHARQPDEIEAEEPLLIHPGSGRPEDDPDLHLKIDTKTGLLAPRTERGRKCIEIFALNLRDQLVVDRKRAIREARWLLFKLFEGDGEAGRELADIRDGKRSFTMAQRAALQEAATNLQPILDST
jgi:hypothetical protein